LPNAVRLRILVSFVAAICTSRMYNLSMNPTKISFSDARGSLTSILDRLEKTGEPVTILRRGKPAAVIVSARMFEQQIRKPAERPWRLAGSIQVKPGLETDAGIAKGRKNVARALKKRMESR
jgi:prevent-host-death family protein